MSCEAGRKMKLTDLLAQSLVNNGVETVFGLQGGAVVHIFDSIEKFGIKAIYTMHEQAASLAAAANARVTGGLGCGVFTTGPGGTNSLTGLLGAWNDSIPCLFVSGQVRSSHMSYNKPVRQVGTQEAPIVDIVSRITKSASVLTDPNDFHELLEESIFIAQSGRPGPVWIDIPLEFQWQQIPVRADLISSNAHKVGSFGATEHQISQFTEMFNNSKSPLLILGNGIHLAHAEDEVRAFIDKYNLQFVETWTAQDLFETKDPRNLGVIGMSGQKGANKAVFASDLLVCLGTHLSIPHTTTLTDTYAPSSKKILVNIDEEQVKNLTLKFDLSINADLKLFLTQVLSSKDLKSKNDCIDVKLKQENWRVSEEKQVNQNDWNRALTLKAPPKSAFIVDGGGTALYAGFQSTQITSTKQRIICSSGMSSMGTGLAETLGVHFSQNYEQLYCIIGDGSFFMNVQDLHSLKQHNVPVIISVINNNGYLAIRHTQSTFQEKRYYGTHPEWGLTFPSIRSVASAFEVPYRFVEYKSEIEEATTELAKFDGPVICEVRVNDEGSTLFSQKYQDNGDGTFTPLGLFDMAP